MITSASANLVSLSTELLVEHILSRLCFESLISCLLTCRHLYMTISSSVLLRYHKELAIAGMIDNPNCSYRTVPLRERLERLRERENNLNFFKFLWTEIYPIPRMETPVWALDASGVLAKGRVVNGDYHPSSIVFAQLPSKPGDPFRWTEPLVFDSLGRGRGLFICAYALAIEEHDLLVCVVEPEDIAHRSSPCIRVLQYSTLKLHPLAKRPLIHWPLPFNWVDNDGEVTVKIYGDHISVSFFNWMSSEAILGVWSWKTGEKKVFMPDGQGTHDDSAFVLFLREDLLLRTNAEDFALDVLYIPPGKVVRAQEEWLFETNDDYSADEEVWDPYRSWRTIPIVQRYLLPKPKPQFEFKRLSITSSPGPSGYGTSNPDKPFTIDPQSDILSIKTCVELDPPVRNFECQYYDFVIHRESLLSAILRRLDNRSASGPLLVSWADWEVDSTRVVPPVSWMPLQNVPLQSVVGERQMVWRNTEQGIEVESMNFRRWSVSAKRMAIKTEIVTGDPKLSANHEGDDDNGAVAIRVVDSSRPAAIPPYLEEIATRLPYISYVRRLSTVFTEGREWESCIVHKILMDGERAVLWIGNNQESKLIVGHF